MTNYGGQIWHISYTCIVLYVDCQLQILKVFYFVNNQYFRILLYMKCNEKDNLFALLLSKCCPLAINLNRAFVGHVLSDEGVSSKAKQSAVEGNESSLIARCWRFTSYLCFCFFEPTEPLSISGNNKYSHSSSTEDCILVFSGIAKIFMVIYRCLTISVAINGIATVIRSVFILSQSCNN